MGVAYREGHQQESAMCKKKVKLRRGSERAVSQSGQFAAIDIDWISDLVEEFLSLKARDST